MKRYMIVLAAPLVVAMQCPVWAQGGSLYPYGAAGVPDWMSQGLGGPPQYLREQAQVDARYAQTRQRQAEARAEYIRTHDLAARPDSWRYVRHNGQWWYYQPDKQWLVYADSTWKPYSDPRGSAKGGPGISRSQ